MNVRTNNIMYKSMMLANRQEVNYVQQGEGQPVILTHGLAASLHDWDDLMPELSVSGYAGYALDLFGHGESHKPADHSEYTVEAVFDHFSSWIESLQIREPMTLIGHSLGGGLSLLYAMRYPERVRALVLINPFYDIGQLPHILQTVFRRQLLNTYLMDLTPYRLFRMIVDVTSFNEYIGDRERHSLPEHIRYQTALDYTRASSGIYKLPSTLPLMKPNHASDPAESLSQINQPTLLLWGERDQTLAPASFPQLAKMLPNLTGTHILPSCGHVPHQCHPETFNPHVMKFLANL